MSKKPFFNFGNKKSEPEYFTSVGQAPESDDFTSIEKELQEESEVEETDELAAAYETIATMEGDIKVTVEVFGDLLRTLGIDPKTFKGQSEDSIRSKIPTIAKNISKALLMGDLDGGAIERAIGITHRFDKYQYLFEDQK